MQSVKELREGPCADNLQALSALERLIAAVPQNQEGLMMAKATEAKTDRQLPALQLLARGAVRSGDADEAAAAQSVVGAFCRGNAEGQCMLAATLKPVGDTSGEQQGRLYTCSPSSL